MFFLYSALIKTTEASMPCIKLTSTAIMVRTGTRTPEEVDGAEEPPTAVAVAIAVTIAETT